MSPTSPFKSSIVDRVPSAYSMRYATGSVTIRRMSASVG